MGTGHAIAVQNFCENLLIAGFVSLHYLASRHLDPAQEVFAFGLLMVMIMVLLNELSSGCAALWPQPLK